MTELQIFKLIDEEVSRLKTEHGLCQTSDEMFDIRDRVSNLITMKLTLNDLIKESLT